MSLQPVRAPVAPIPSSPGLLGHNLGGTARHGGDISCPSPHYRFGPHQVLLSLCLISLWVKKCPSLLPPSPRPAASQHSPWAGSCLLGQHGSSPVPGLAACSAAVPRANGRGQAVAALSTAGSGVEAVPSSSRGCSASAIAQRSLPSHPPTLPLPHPHRCHAGCHGCHPCPAPEGHGAPWDHLDLGASPKDGGSFSYQANWEARSGSVRAERMEKPPQAFPIGITVPVAAVPPSCVADGACHNVIPSPSPLLP